MSMIKPTLLLTVHKNISVYVSVHFVKFINKNWRYSFNDIQT